ncbi:MAG: cysteine desulfurase [Thaumarchaeota archaeon]|nr:cysteine desulfurase [Nitrososphaerota archaeon]
MKSLDKIREDFPVLSRRRKSDGKPLIYFDSAATSLKPRKVIEAIRSYYEEYSANVHRGIYELSRETTELYERSREKVAEFIGCDASELVFVKNTTEGINLVAYGLRWRKGDVVVSTVLEHHSNMVPWQIIKKRFGVELKYAKVSEDGRVDLDHLASLVDGRTRLIAINHVSNVLGTINDVKKAAKIAHENGALLLIDGAQSVPHIPVNVEDLECDFLAFSGHKLLGPTGIGGLYIKEEVEEELDPPFGGGEMISEVELYDYKVNDMPWRFEPGTPNIAGAIGFAAAVEYLQDLGMNFVREHEKTLTSKALEILDEIDGIEVYGPRDPDERCGLVSFNLKGVNGDRVAVLLDEYGNIAVRSGFHCAQPLHSTLGVKSSVRASFYIYNTLDELEVFREAMEKIAKELRENNPSKT